MLTEAAQNSKSHARTAHPVHAAFAIAIGVVITYCVYGYQFGHGNHGVYLLDALRRVDPTLLRNDWFTTHTLQYHVVFTQIAAILMREGILAPGFVVIYALMLVCFHIAWRGIVRHLGGSDGAYLLSVAFYYLSAGGTGLGMYQFLQDSSVLPSNIAGIAMLWALWLWMIDRRGWSGVCFGIAGVFHLNFALIGSAAWIMLSIWPPLAVSRLRSREMILGTVAAIIPDAANILFALRSKLTSSNAMPLTDFVNLYVHLRHPHHYDPASWPVGIWIAFLWTLIPALVLLRGQAERIYHFFLAMIVIALVGAGLRFTSETLIQMSLYRFSIYLQLFGCAAAGVLVERSFSVKEEDEEPRRHEATKEAQRRAADSSLRAFFAPSCLRGSSLVGLTICIIIAGVCVVRGPFFGFFKMPQDDPQYLKLCDWVSKNTPVGAVFLVPPSEESMRLIGRRAIVINFKCVPQLSGELSEWAGRLSDVLDMRDITVLPHDYTRVLQAVGDRYDRIPTEHLTNIAAKYRATYIVTTHALEGHDAQHVPIDATGRYMLYDLTR